MLNIAYKHLDSKLRIGDLTVVQWLGIFAGVVLAVVYGNYVHPFGTMLTLMSAVYVGGIPVAAVLLAGFSEFDVMLVIGSAARWRRMDGRFVPGPGDPTEGYRLDDVGEEPQRAEDAGLAELDLDRLWREQ